MLIFLLIISCCLLATIICIQVPQWNYNKHKQFVLLHSISLKELKLLNNEYHFYNASTQYIQCTYDNEHSFADISCQDYLIYQLQYEQRKIKQQMIAIDKNRIDYEKYKNELSNLTQCGTYSTSYDKLNLEKLIKIEKAFLQQEIKQPTTNFSIAVCLYCSTINGSIYDRKSQVFNKNEVNNLIERVNHKNGTFFTDNEIWNAICRVERGKVSNKMRFSLYQRDGYRCLKCGISQEYANLEIDHIVPIAKGGKSTYNNLQTLCHRCNVAKGDSIANYLNHH